MVRAWHRRGMASVNQTRPQCVNEMVKTHSKPLAARHGRGMAWARHAMCESALKGFGFVAFFAGVKASSFCIHLSCLLCCLSVVRGE
jgi:hypothetical protein